MQSSKVLFYDFDEFRLEVEKQLLFKNGQSVTLTRKAFQILLILVQNSGQIIEKETIFAELWADSFVEESNLTQYVYVLRKLLGRKSDGQPFIETIARRGYVFKAEVKTIFPVSPVVSEQKVENGLLQFQPPPQSNGHLKSDQVALYSSHFADSNLTEKFNQLIDQTNPAAVAQSDKTEKAFKNGSLSIILLTIIVLGALGIPLYLQNQNSPNVSTKIKSLAILPFKPIGEESKNEKLGLGMADAVITRLSKLQEIPVRPTSAIFNFTDQADVNPWAAGRDLNVDAVLEGSVQRDGEMVRVSARLIKTAGGKPLWADNFDEKFINIFALQDSISSKVARAITLNLSDTQEHLLTQRATTDPAAYQAFSFGIYFYNRRTKEGLNKAIAYFQKAIEIDPNYAQAYAGIADSYNMLGHYNFADMSEMMGKARAAATKALALNDQLAEAHIAIAYVQANERDFDATQQSLERAIALAPYNSVGHIRYGWQQLRRRRLPETVEQMRLAHEYDPLSPLSNNTLCAVLMLERNFSEALGYCEKAVELSPDAPSNRLTLANAYYFNGRPDDAIAEAQTEIETGDEKTAALGSLGFFYAKTGRTKEAVEIVERLKREKESDVLLDLILVSYALGKKGEGFVYFKRAYEKEALTDSMFPYDPAWDEVRADPRVAELIK